jgi:hypothetical protein
MIGCKHGRIPEENFPDRRMTFESAVQKMPDAESIPAQGMDKIQIQGKIAGIKSSSLQG